MLDQIHSGIAEDIRNPSVTEADPDFGFCYTLS